jgi:rod shape determining protein RodA
LVLVTAVSYGREVAVGTSRRDRRSVLSLLRHLDLALVGATFALSLVGVVMVYTATRNALLQAGLDRHYYLERQALWVVLGTVIMAVVASIDYRRFKDLGYVIYGLALLSLIGVFVVGHAQYGSQRWYQLGPLTLQPSEFAAIGLFIAIGKFCSNRQGLLSFKEVACLIGFAALPILLVFKQPDLGTAIILAVTFAALMVTANVPLRYIVLLFVGAIGAFVAALNLHLLDSYQLSRLTGFLHQSRDIRGANYDLTMSRNAVASGGVHGTGLERGPYTNLSIVPNQQNDFIFSAIGEQLGFVGSAAVVGLFGVVAFRMLRAAQTARDSFGRLVCAGAFAFLAFSVFENIGMTIGLMPITGIPLPFVSYGGSAVFAFFATVGLVLNVEMRRLSRR